MEARPPALIEALVGRFIPPGACEPVLGDLHERYTTPARYMLDAAMVVPRLVAARLRRIVAADYTLLAGEVAGLTLAMMKPHAAAPAGARVSPLLVPAAIVLLVLVVRDAYVDPRRLPGDRDSRQRAFDDSLARSIGDALLAIACAWLIEFIVVPGAYRAASSALAGFSGIVVLLLVVMRTAWWALYAPGTRASRFQRAMDGSDASGEDVGTQLGALRRRALGLFAWRVVAWGGIFAQGARLAARGGHTSLPEAIFVVCAMTTVSGIYGRAVDQLEEDRQALERR